VSTAPPNRRRDLLTSLFTFVALIAAWAILILWYTAEHPAVERLTR
jgi:hypothetical protein